MENNSVNKIHKQQHGIFIFLELIIIIEYIIVNCILNGATHLPPTRCEEIGNIEALPLQSVHQH